MSEILRKIWNFLWHEEDIGTLKGALSLIVNIILAFLIIKFLFYPALGFALNTDYPIVGVLSESMEHQQIHPCLQYNAYKECVKRDPIKYEVCGNVQDSWQHIDLANFWQNCGAWYENNTISFELFSDFPLSQGFSKGDMLIIYGSKPENIEPGDIIVFESDRRYPIIHRVIRKYEEDGQIYYQTKGDHNIDSIKELGLNELKIAHDEKTFKGKAVLWIPYLGYVKLIPTNIMNFIIGR